MRFWEIAAKLLADGKSRKGHGIWHLSKLLMRDTNFMISDENGLPRVVYRRYGQALVLSITLVPGKAYTAAITQCKTKDVAAAAEVASLMGIQTNDPRITLVAGGYLLLVNWKDCRRNWRWRWNRGTGLQNSGICSIRI
jgi:hypothetical protein